MISPTRSTLRQCSAALAVMATVLLATSASRAAKVDKQGEYVESSLSFSESKSGEELTVHNFHVRYRITHFVQAPIMGFNCRWDGAYKRGMLRNNIKPHPFKDNKKALAWFEREVSGLPWKMAAISPGTRFSARIHFDSFDKGIMGYGFGAGPFVNFMCDNIRGPEKPGFGPAMLGSPSWDDMFYFDRAGTRPISAELAKKIVLAMKNMDTVIGDVKVMKAEVDLSAVEAHRDKLIREALKKFPNGTEEQEDELANELDDALEETEGPDQRPAWEIEGDGLDILDDGEGNAPRDFGVMLAEADEIATENARRRAEEALRIKQLLEKARTEGGKLQGRISDAISGKGLSDVKIAVLLKSQTAGNYQTTASGEYDIPLLHGVYQVQFTRDGYLPSDAVVRIHGRDVTSMVQLRQIPVGHDGIGTAAGRINNAFNSQSVSGVKLTFHRGINSTIEDAAASAISDNKGRYQVELAAGNYTVRGDKLGFSSVYGTVVVIGNKERPNQNFTIAPKIGAGEIRIVLSWGRRPTDLDSHLKTPGGEHIFYSARNGNNVNLDVDDTDGYGPETITIKKRSTGEYQYWVKNYSGDSDLSNSRGVVDVYGENGLLRSFNVPSSLHSETWQVFRFSQSTSWLSGAESSIVQNKSEIYD